MASRIVFLDTETCGLALDDPIWDVALIVRDPGQPDVEHQFYVEHDVTAAEKLPDPFRADHDKRYDPALAIRRHTAMQTVEDLTHGAHIVGAVPNFDTERIAQLMIHTGNKPGWHHHLIDVENLAVGYLYGSANTERDVEDLTLPWDSDKISALLGITVPEDQRHTALGDARWARDLYDAVTR